MSGLICMVKPRIRPMVQQSINDEEDIKTPFALIKIRYINCIKGKSETSA